MSRTLSLILLALFILSLTPTIPLSTAISQPVTIRTPTLTPTSTKTIDGNPSDWTGTPPSQYNTWIYSNGEWIWRDAVNDERNDFAQIYIDGQDWDWNNNRGTYLVAYNYTPSGFDGANLTELYVAWDTKSLYIAIRTDNRAEWGLAYGIGIDVNGSASGFTHSDNGDAWGRHINFTQAHAIDYELYFWYDTGSHSVKSAYAYKWNGAGWDDISSGMQYATTVDSNGLKFLEINITWSSMGLNSIPSNISIISWIAGGDSSSAVDSVPYDPTINTLDGGSDEWSDWDNFTHLANVYLTEVNEVIDTRVDLVEWRISGDTSNLYMMFKLENTTGINLGESGAPLLIVTLDKDRVAGSGQTSLPEYADTYVTNYASWEFAIVINLADSRLSGRTYTNTSGAIDKNYGAILTVYDNSTSKLWGVGQGEIAVNLDENFIEIAIPWSVFNYTSAPNDAYLRFTLMTARGYSNYQSNTSNTWDVSGTSDALDVVTDQPSTWDEVSDGAIDYYADVYFVDGEPTTPPAQLSFEPPTSPSGSVLYVGDTITAKVLLQVADSPKSGQAIWVYVNGVNQSSLGGFTNSSGEYSFNLPIDSTMIGTLNLTVYYPGNATLGTTHTSATNLYTVEYKVRFVNVALNATTDSLGEPVKATGTLEYYDGSTWTPVSHGEEIDVVLGSTILGTGKTRSDGSFTVEFTAPTYIGSWSLIVKHPENTTSHTAENQTSVQLTVIGIRQIDGSINDWIGKLPLHINMWNITNNELVWNDAYGDERTDYTYPNHDYQVDLRQFRVTIDQYYLYFTIKLNDTSFLHLGDDGAPMIVIMIDIDQLKGSGQLYIPGSGTQVDPYAAWEYAIVVNTADSRYNGKGLQSTTVYLNSSTNNWGAIFQLLDSSWNHIYYSGIDSHKGIVSVDLSNGIIEGAISLDILGISAGSVVRFSVADGRGSSDYYNNGGGMKDGKVLDAVTGYEPNTWDDVQDNGLNYSLTVKVSTTYTLSPGNKVFINWLNNTAITIPSDLPFKLAVEVNDSLGNLLSHRSFGLYFANNDTLKTTAEADGLGRAVFELTLPAGTYTFYVHFESDDGLPSNNSETITVYSQPIYPTTTTISYVLINDADSNGNISSGDTVRFIVKVTYHNTTDDTIHPLPNVDVRINNTALGLDQTVTTNSDGVATYDYTIPSTDAAKYVIQVTYAGNASAAGIPRFYGSTGYTALFINMKRAIDGKLEDWNKAVPSTTPGVMIYSGEVVVTDPSGDETPYSSNGWPITSDVDIVEYRMTFDDNYVYMLFKFDTLSNVYSPYIMILMNTTPNNPSEGNSWLPDFTDAEWGVMLDTNTHSIQKWNYVFTINYDKSKDYVGYYDTGYNYHDIAGSYLAFNTTGGFIEAAIPISVFGGSLAGKSIRFAVVVFANDFGGAWDPHDKLGVGLGSDVYDVLGVSGTLYYEVYDNDGNAGNDVWPQSDHWVDFSLGVTLDSQNSPLITTRSVTSATYRVYDVSGDGVVAVNEWTYIPIFFTPNTEGNYVELKEGSQTLWRGIVSNGSYVIAALKFNTKGTHTVDVYVDGSLVTSITIEVAGYPSIINVTSISLKDTDKDGLPDEINITGRLVWSPDGGLTWYPLNMSNTTDIYLVYMYYNLTETAINNYPAYILDDNYKILLATVTPDDNGYFNLTNKRLPSLPNGYPEGGYVLVFKYNGDSQRAPATNTSIDISKKIKTNIFIPLYNSLPTTSFTLTGTEPGVYIGNGELLIIDPASDYATDNLQGGWIVDLNMTRIGVFNGYLVINVTYWGQPGELANYVKAVGNSVPIFVVLLDTTPNDPNDGVDSYLWMVSGYAWSLFDVPSYGRYPNPPYSRWVRSGLVTARGTAEVKYTEAIIFSPVEPTNPETNYVAWIVKIGPDGSIMAYPAGIVTAKDLDKNSFTAYIPLQTLGITSTHDLVLWAVSGEVYTGGTIYLREIIPDSDQPNYSGKYWHTMIYDVPGTSFLPSTANENIYAAIYNYSMVLTLDPNNGFTKLYARLIPVQIPTSINNGLLYVGPAENHTFIYKLYGSEADLPIIGIDAVLSYNTTTYTATSGNDGVLTYQFPVPNAHAGKNVTIQLTPSTLVELVQPVTYNLHIVYYTRIVNATMTWYDLDHDGLVSRGDKLSFYTKVEVYDENGNWVPMAGIKVSFWVYSTPYLLGSNTTDNNGVAIFNYTVTGNEGIVGIHNFVAQAGDNIVSGVTSTVVTGGANIQVFMQPAPEPPILPIILLAAILLFIIIKKRK